MSNVKYDAMVRQGIEIGERVSLPADRIPEDARVEMDAKKAAGYYAEELPTQAELTVAKGRGLGDYEAS